MNKIPSNELLDLQAPNISLRPGYEAIAFESVRMVWRRKWLVVLMLLPAVLVGLAFLALAEKRYDAEAIVRLDFAAEQQGRTANATPAVSLDAAAVVEGEAGIIRSRMIARGAVRRLRLEENPDFAAGRHSRRKEITAWFQKTFGADSILAALSERILATAWEISADDRLMLELMRGLTVRNDSRSYLIRISYSWQDPDFAAAAANAFAEEYMQSRIEASFGNANRNMEWLAAQIRDTRSSLAAAELAIREFRQSTGFVEASPGGATLQEQKLRELSAQLSTATLNRIQQETRLARVREIVISGAVPAVSDVSGSPAVQRLLENEVAAKRDVDRLASTLAARHPQLARARAELADIQKRIGEELEKTISMLEAELSGTIVAEQELQERIDDLQLSLIEGRAQEGRMRQLQIDADSIRDRLKILTENHEAAAALAALKPVAAQLVAPAEPMAIPSYPKAHIALSLAIMLGLGSGVGLAMVLERRDSGFRTSSQLADETGVRCVGMLPRITRSSSATSRVMKSEAVRSLMVACGLNTFTPQGAMVVITSSLPCEGKTALLAWLSKSLVAAGHRVLVVSDLRFAAPSEETKDRASVEEIASSSDGGRSFFENSRPERPLVLYRDPRPLAGRSDIASADLEGCLQRARQHFDAILVEAPPAMLCAETASLVRMADITLYAVRWNSTPRKVVIAALRHLLSYATPLTVITGVDLKKHRRYGIFDQCSCYFDYKKFFSPRKRLA